MEVILKLIELIKNDFDSVLYNILVLVIVFCFVDYASKKRRQQINMIRKCTICEYLGKASFEKKDNGFLDVVVTICFLIFCFAAWFFCINASALIHMILLLSITALYIIYLKWSLSEIIKCPDCEKINSMTPADSPEGQ